jgi:hypothetical protein
MTDSAISLLFTTNAYIVPKKCNSEFLGYCWDPANAKLEAVESYVSTGLFEPFIDSLKTETTMCVTRNCMSGKCGKSGTNARFFRFGSINFGNLCVHHVRGLPIGAQNCKNNDGAGNELATIGQIGEFVWNDTAERVS